MEVLPCYGALQSATTDGQPVNQGHATSLEIEIGRDRLRIEKIQVGKLGRLRGNVQRAGQRMRRTKNVIELAKGVDGCGSGLVERKR